jgi:hypothetical protein
MGVHIGIASWTSPVPLGAIYESASDLSTPTTWTSARIISQAMPSPTSAQNVLAMSAAHAGPFPAVSLACLIVASTASPTHLPGTLPPNPRNKSTNAPETLTPGCHLSPTVMPFIVSCCFSRITVIPKNSTTLSSPSNPFFHAVVERRLSTPHPSSDARNKPITPRTAVSRGSDPVAPKYAACAGLDRVEKTRWRMAMRLVVCNGEGRARGSWVGR